jgi:hypothetical protein
MSQQESLFQKPAAPAESPATPAAPQPVERPDLAAQLRDTQRQLSNLLVLVLVVSGTLTILLLQQVRYARADLASLQVASQQLEQARQLIANYNQRVPAIQQFVSKLQDYAKTHPDVLPILDKYGMVQRAPASGTAPAESP